MFDGIFTFGLAVIIKSFSAKITSENSIILPPLLYKVKIETRKSFAKIQADSFLLFLLVALSTL